MPALNAGTVSDLGGVVSSLNITAAKVIKAGPGRLVRIIILVALGTGDTTFNDCAAVADKSAANAFFTIPTGTAVGLPIFIDWPCIVGIVVGTFSSSGTIAVSYS